MQTETQTAGTNTTDTGTPASPETMLTDAPATAQPGDQTVAPTTDTKPEGDAKPAEAKPTEAAPVEYDFKAPEGTTLNEEVIGEFKELAKEKNLPPEEAQKFVDLGVKAIQQAQARQAEALAQAQAKWAEDSRADKEFGGDALEANLSVAKRALDTFGSPELKKMLTESGLGNHPEIIRAFTRVGKAISEDKLVPGSTKPAGSKTAEQLLYPSMNT